MRYAVIGLMVVLAGCAGGAPVARDARLGQEMLWLRLDDGMRCAIPRTASTGSSAECGGISWQIEETPTLVQRTLAGSQAEGLVLPAAKVVVTSADGVVRRFDLPDRSGLEGQGRWVWPKKHRRSGN